MKSNALCMLALTWRFIFVLALAPALLEPARAQDEAIAAGPALNVTLLVDSDVERCYDRGYADAIRRLAGIEQDKINADGGIAGRPLELTILDGRRDIETTTKNLRGALSMPELLAVIGLTSSTRGKAVFKALGKEIGESKAPFISHISVAEIFKDYPHVYSTRPSQEAERVPVMAAFIAASGFESVAYLGRTEAAYIEAIAAGMKASDIGDRIIVDHRVPRVGRGIWGKLDADALNAAVADMKTKDAKLVTVAVGTSRTHEVLEALMAASYTPTILLVGDVARIAPEVTRRYPNAIYQLNWDRVPEADQDAIRSVVTKSNPEDWVFGGTKIPEAPGWKNGSCPEEFFAEPFSNTNLRAIGLGAQYADMVNLVVAAARKAGRSAKLDQMRQSVLHVLKTKYVAGKGAFKGRFQNWSFHAGSRVRAQTPFVIILPQGLGRTQLAPVQFVRTRAGNLRRIDTLYVDIDLIRAYGIDSNEKSFFAEFYMAMRATDRLDLKDIAFTNAFIDPRTNGPHLSTETVHPGGESDAYPASMRIYRISGRFRFTPDFSAYPFDSQKFSIDIQPKNRDKPFVVQSPPLELRDQELAVDGWRTANQYVSFIRDFVPVVDAFTHEASIVPFYQTRFVWQMKRETTDYYLRVVVPLAFILIVAYLSIFIPQGHLEAIVTIQVTALLSAVALYLSLPQIDSDTATISDRIFVLDYMMVSIMIVISILRINVRVAKLGWLNKMLTFTHIVVIPAIVLIAVGMILRALPVETITELLTLAKLEGLKEYVLR